MKHIYPYVPERTSWLEPDDYPDPVVVECLSCNTRHSDPDICPHCDLARCSECDELLTITGHGEAYCSNKDCGIRHWFDEKWQTWRPE